VESVQEDEDEEKEDQESQEVRPAHIKTRHRGGGKVFIVGDTESEREDAQRAVGGSRNPVADSSGVELLDDAVTDDLAEHLSVVQPHSRASRSVSVRGAETAVEDNNTSSLAGSDNLFAVFREALLHRDFENLGHESNEFLQFIVAKDLALFNSYNSFDSIQTVASWHSKRRERIVLVRLDQRERDHFHQREATDPYRTFRRSSIASPLALRCSTSITMFSG